jgi:hypothetical protein
MIQNIQAYGYPLGIAAVCAAAAVGLWKNKHLHWVSVCLFGFVAFLLPMGLTVWRDALARLVDSGPGFVILLVVAVILGIDILVMIVRAPLWGKAAAAGGMAGKAPRGKHPQHRIKHPLMMVIAGTVAFLLIGSATRLVTKVARSPRKTGEALGHSVSQIASGHAAHGISQHGALKVLMVAVIILIAAGMIAHRHEKRTGGRGRGRGALPQGFAQPAVSQGSSGSGSSRSGQPAVKAGR